MNHQIGRTRTLSLLFALAILLSLPVPALAAESAAEVPEVPQASESHTPDKPEKTERPHEQPQKQSEASAQEDPDQTDSQPDKPEKKQGYSASWSDAAFLGQTVNYMDELIIGLGTSITIDPEHDIQLIKNGKAKGGPDKGDVSIESSNPRYISVSGDELHAERKGNAQIEVTVALPDGGQKQLRKSVKIVDEPDIRFEPSSALLASKAKLDLGQYAKNPFLKASPNVNARVNYSVEPMVALHNSRVKLDERTGKLSVSYDSPGDVYQITASTYGGKTACFTLYLGERADRVEILLAQGTLTHKGALQLAPGEAIALSAALFCGEDMAARQDVSWSVDAPDGMAQIDETGLLQIAQDPGKPLSFNVTAKAKDGSGTKGRLAVVVNKSEA